MENKGGTVQAVGAGSKVVFSTSADGGTFKGSAGGTVDFDGATLDGRTNAITLQGPSFFGNTKVEGTIVNNGTMTSGGSGAAMKVMAEDVVLTGGGTVRLAGAYDLPGIYGNSAGARLTNVNNTIAGVGYISWGDLSVVNHGTITADKDGYKPDDMDVLSLDTLAALTNDGVLGAGNGSVLKILNPVSGVVANTGGVIQATGKGSQAYLYNLAVDGGVLKGTGGGRVGLERVTLDGTKHAVTLAGEGDFYTVTLKGAVANTGDFTLVARNNVVVGPSATLTGGGSIDVTYDRLWGANPSVKGVDGGGKLVNADHTIHGDGFFRGFTLVNGAKGRIVADRAIVPGTNDNHSLDIVTGATVTNSGRMEAWKGATMIIGDKVANAGLILADGGTVDIRGKVTGPGHIEVRNGGTAVVDRGVDHEVLFSGAGAGTLFLSTRSPAAGVPKGFDFTIGGIGLGDRVKLDAGGTAGKTAEFSYIDATSKGGFLSAAAFTDADAKPYKVFLSGAYSEGQFSLVGGKDGLLGYLRVKTHDGTAKADILKAAAGGERVIGLGGDDVLIGGKGNDLLDGSTGSDTASYATAKGAVSVSLATKAYQNVGGGMGRDSLISIENLVGSAGSDKLTGNGAANVLFGGKGADDLFGGSDKQTDTFVFTKGDSGLRASAMDQIFDFHADTNGARGKRSAGADLIDLSLINGSQKLSFVSSLAKTGKGQVDVDTVGSGAKAHAQVTVDWDGNEKADMSFEVMNVLKLSADDFLL